MDNKRTSTRQTGNIAPCLYRLPKYVTRSVKQTQLLGRFSFCRYRFTVYRDRVWTHFEDWGTISRKAGNFSRCTQAFLHTSSRGGAWTWPITQSSLHMLKLCEPCKKNFSLSVLLAITIEKYIKNVLEINEMWLFFNSKIQHKWLTTLPKRYNMIIYVSSKGLSSEI